MKSFDAAALLPALAKTGGGRELQAGPAAVALAIGSESEISTSLAT